MTFVSQTAPLNQPVITPLVSTLVHAARLAVQAVTDRRHPKADAGPLNEAQLRDIGLTQNDILKATPVQLPSDGGLTLMDIRRSRPTGR